MFQKLDAVLGSKNKREFSTNPDVSKASLYPEEPSQGEAVVRFQVTWMMHIDGGQSPSGQDSSLL